MGTVGARLGMPRPDARRRRRRSTARAVVLGLTGILGPTVVAHPAAAQLVEERSIDIDRFRPVFDPSGFLTIPATRTPGPDQWDVGFWTDYDHRALVVTDPSDSGAGDRAVLDHRVRGRVTGSLGFGGRLSAGVGIPFVMHQRGDAQALADERDTLTPAALGDVRLALKVRALGAEAKPTRERPRGFGLAFQGVLTVPTGADQAFTSEPNARTELRVIADYHLFGLGVGASFGWLHRFEQRPLLGVTFRDELDAALGIMVPLPARRAPAILFEARTTVDARRPFGDAARTFAELDLAARWRVAEVTMTFGVGAGLTDGVGSPRVRAFAAFHFGPRVEDADLDGVPDDRDQCRQLAEDLDGFEDEDGCLDPDDDLDGILDADDACPRDPADFDNDADEDGCPDGPPTTADPPPDRLAPPLGGMNPRRSPPSDQVVPSSSGEGARSFGRCSRAPAHRPRPGRASGRRAGPPSASP